MPAGNSVKPGTLTCFAVVMNMSGFMLSYSLSVPAHSYETIQMTLRTDKMQLVETTEVKSRNLVLKICNIVNY